MLGMRIMKLVLYWLDVAAFLGLGLLVFTNLPWHTQTAAGLALALCGFALWMVARFQLGRSFTVRAQARSLVTRGLYSRIRNPIYLFGEIAYLDLAVAWGRWIGYLWIAVTSAVQLLRIKKQESVLEQALGEEYRWYKAGTWF
jgi:protein-S-isoprenylcysteine O-methyltransferase Ste14